ncbi:MOP flippase family protein [Tellurirhabdus bombi]|uniref:MOP flippase family protein n=1 Tax=Tellurirhabdus bombi TaxID=2907205 RepID=UPI001F36C39F|nr:MOP flippase family protein [Tellurirhabdus bombi]
MTAKNKAINGGKWITVSTIISTAFQFIQVSILARLLDPAVFGVVSVSTLIINFFYIFGNLGFSNSIISKQESDPKILSTLYYLGFILGAIIFVVIFFSSPLVVAYYKEPKLDRVIKIASFYFLIIYFGQIYLFLLQKELMFKSVAIIEILGAVIGTTVAITLAYNHFEEVSLIYGQLATQTVRAVLSVVFGYKLFKPLFYFNFKAIQDHLRFGLYNVGDGVLGFVQGNSDNILVGGLLGVKLLGYYTIAYQLAIFPITKLNPIILQVAYPMIAKMKSDDNLIKQSYIKILDLVSYLNFPLLAGLLVTADSVVPLLYGEGWDETIHLIKIFVFVSAFNCLTNPLFTLAFAKGKPNLLFYLNLIILVIKIPLIYIFSNYWGITGIAFAFLTATFIDLILAFFVTQYLIGDFFKEFMTNLAKPLLFCLAMILAVGIYKMYAGQEGVLHTLAQVVIGGLIFLGLTFRFKVSLSEVKSFRQSL